MPIYEYRCRSCGASGSELESVRAPRVKKCPECGKRTFARLVSAAAFHLKGGGWYATDFKDGGKKQKPAEKEKVSAKEGDGGVKDAKDGDKPAGKERAEKKSAEKSSPKKGG